MDKFFEQALLYDFYGELLTPHQRTIYEDAVFNDMSLGEIAQEQGISRQGVHDLIKRCDKILQDYEGKLHLVERFAQAKHRISEIVALTGCSAVAEEGMTGKTDAGGDLENDGYPVRMKRIYEISQELLREL